MNVKANVRLLYASKGVTYVSAMLLAPFVEMPEKTAEKIKSYFTKEELPEICGQLFCDYQCSIFKKGEPSDEELTAAWNGFWKYFPDVDATDWFKKQQDKINEKYNKDNNENR